MKLHRCPTNPVCDSPELELFYTTMADTVDEAVAAGLPIGAAVAVMARLLGGAILGYNLHQEQIALIHRAIQAYLNQFNNPQHKEPLQ